MLCRAQVTTKLLTSDLHLAIFTCSCRSVALGTEIHQLGATDDLRGVYQRQLVGVLWFISGLDNCCRRLYGLLCVQDESSARRVPRVGRSLSGDLHTSAGMDLWSSHSGSHWNGLGGRDILWTMCSDMDLLRILCLDCGGAETVASRPNPSQSWAGAPHQCKRIRY